MMDTQIIEYLKGKLDEEVQIQRENLSTGAVKDYAEYREVCGVIRGLLTAHRELNDLLRKVKEHNDSV